MDTAATRVLGVDAGEVRIGVAISDPNRMVATPLDTVPGVQTTAAQGQDEAGSAATRLAELARANGCDTVVVGLPRALSGRDTASTAMARGLATALRAHGLRVELWDERFSSTEAERVLIGAGRRREQRKLERDRIAATIILQGWLDAQRL